MLQFGGNFPPGLLDKLEEVVSQERIREELQKMFKHDTIAAMRLLSKIDAIEPRLMEIMFKGAIWLMPSAKK